MDVLNEQEVVNQEITRLKQKLFEKVKLAMSIAKFFQELELTLKTKKINSGNLNIFISQCLPINDKLSTIRESDSKNLNNLQNSNEDLSHLIGTLLNGLDLVTLEFFQFGMSQEYNTLQEFIKRYNDIIATDNIREAIRKFREKN